MIVTENTKPETAVETTPQPEVAAQGNAGNTEETRKGMFSDSRIAEDDVVHSDEVDRSGTISTGEKPDYSDVVVSGSDKVYFIDSMVNNTRFEKTYTLFGKIPVTLRSLTNDEVQALAAWTLKKGTEDPSGSFSGKYRKYILSAHVSRFNGIDIPALPQPLFSTLGEDGRTVIDPGWVDKCGFWDGKPYGIIQALVVLVEKFNRLYAALCSKAEDENFWNPDTP